ncbi:MAG TPA: hypothetical protein VHS99_17595, partial [Chloroflexota bacterium]|nr:hypothetical protein [Chloroflexota bacterium]
MTAAEGAARAGGAPGAAEYPLRPLQRLPYPVRNVVRRWRGTLGMILGVGIALGVAMTIMAVSQATVEIYTADFKRTGANLYVMTQGGTLIPVLPSDTPGTIRHARGVLSQVQRWPEVSAAIGVMNGALVRETEGRR